jgi:hypothetical protein
MELHTIQIVDNINWKDHCKGFIIQKSTLDWEGKCLAIVAALNKIPCKFVNNIDKVENGWIPSGNVPWVSSLLGKTITPDYFPEFLKGWVTRKIWREEKWPLYKTFIKPADRHKRFTGFITSGTYSGKKKGPFICSDIVHFTNEWRYYIAYGKLIGAYWYWGDDDEPIDAPKLDIQWPKDWCGTADFGTMDNGKIELIESHPPFACGWYGKTHEEYAEFLTLGWRWLLKISMNNGH